MLPDFDEERDDGGAVALVESVEEPDRDDDTDEVTAAGGCPVIEVGAALHEERARAARRALRGRLYMLASSLAFAGMGLVAKLLPATISSGEKVFFRSFFGLLMLVAAYRLTGSSIGRPGNVRGLAARGTFGALALVAYFYAIDTAGLVKATLYCYTFPIFAAVISWLEGGERPRPRTVAALVVAMLGTMLTLDTAGWVPALSSGDMAGLLSGLLSGAAVVSVRKLHRTETSAWIVIAFTAVSSVVTVPYLVAGFEMPSSGVVIAGVLALAVSATAAQWMMTKAYRYLPAVEGAVLSLATVPLSAMLAMLVLPERLSPRFCVGAALVFGVTVLMNFQSPAPPAAVDEAGQPVDAIS